MRLGYFRAAGDGASKQELRTLESAGCSQILIDSVTGNRSQTLALRLQDLSAGDELVVLRLNHLMAMPGLLGLLTDLIGRGIIVMSLQDDIRTSDPGVTATLMSLGKYNALPGNSQPKRRGRTPVLKAEDIERARQMIQYDKMPVAKVAAVLGVSRATIYRHLPPAA